MTVEGAFAQLAAGFRLALILFAVMSLLTATKWAPDALTDARRLQAQRLSAEAWALLAISVLIYSPAHASWLLGHPAPKAINRALDALASCLACLAFVKLLAFRGLMQGLTWPRIRSGIRMNIVIMVAVVGTAWLTR